MEARYSPHAPPPNKVFNASAHTRIGNDTYAMEHVRKCNNELRTDRQVWHGVPHHVDGDHFLHTEAKRASANLHVPVHALASSRKLKPHVNADAFCIEHVRELKGRAAKVSEPSPSQPRGYQYGGDALVMEFARVMRQQNAPADRRLFPPFGLLEPVLDEAEAGGAASPWRTREKELR